MGSLQFAVFTKPWKDIGLEQLAEKARAMGFDAVEYPLREGYQVQPADGVAGIVRLKHAMAAAGVGVASIAGGVDVRFVESTNAVTGIDEALFAGCGEAGVKIIRICQSLDTGLDFHRNLDLIRRKYHALMPYCEKYGVTLGVQMHCGACIASAAETYILLKEFDPRYIAAVWDSGHNGLAGTEPSVGLDTVWEMLCMVNFKAAYWRRTTGPEAEAADWDAYWTTGRHALGRWDAAVNHLVKRGYRGTVCLPAEYSDEPAVERLAREDLAYLKALFAQAEAK